jgi:hypothetical protein
MELHTVVERPPSGVVGEMFPVEVTTIGVGMVPNAAAGVITAVEAELGAIDDVGTGIAATEGDGGVCLTGVISGPGTPTSETIGIAMTVLPVAEVEELAGIVDVVGGTDIDCVIPPVPAIDDGEVTCTAGVPGVICPVGVEQVTTVPGTVGSEASGTGANVVSGAPGWVVAENGLGPLSGEVTIAPGVDGSPMAVVPMVETCARLALEPSSRAAAMSGKRRIAMTSSVPTSLSAVCVLRPCCLPPSRSSD